jgi:hypothetical protein
MVINKVFNGWTLIILNALVIFIVEITGDYFANTGFIHLLAIIFIALAFVRAFNHTHVHDQFLEPIIHRGIFAMVVFAISHIVEYSGFMIFNLPRAAVSANVVNFYLASTLIVITGVEVFVGRMNKLSQNLSKIFEVLAIFFVILIIYILFNTKSINLSPTNWLAYAYSSAIIVIESVSIWRLFILKSKVPLMTNFINYFIGAFVLIGLSALFYTQEETLSMAGIPFLQLIYISHFLFYGALSLIFLAYDRLLNLGGLYNDLEKISLQH